MKRLGKKLEKEKRKSQELQKELNKFLVKQKNQKQQMQNEYQVTRKQRNE